MSSEWRLATIEEIAAPQPSALATGPFGSSISSKYFTASGVPVIRGSNLSAEVSARLLDEGLVFVSPEKAEEFQRSIARRGDLVFTCWGTINQVGFIDRHAKYDSYIVSNKQMKLTVDSTKVDPRFLYYVFSAPEKQKEILDNGIGSSVPGFNLGQLRRHEVRLPSLRAQVLIADFLESFDDRIALLRETNATLEAISQALFKSWFVDFDPVRAKQQSCAPESMDEATAALFPDGFEESELGLIPKGWRMCSFTDVVNVIGGGTPRTTVAEYWSGDIPWFSVVDAPTDTDVFVVDTEKKVTQAGVDNSSTKVLPAGTTIISARGTVGRLALTGCDMAMNQSCYGLRGKSNDMYFTYLCTYRLVETLKQRTHGSVFDTITRDTLAGVSTVYPDKIVIQAFEASVSPLMERIRENLMQARTLTSLRDTLLPRLVSGQLRLPEAEALVA